MKLLLFAALIVSYWEPIYIWGELNPPFFMTAQNFMNVVRFKLKSDCVDKYFEVIDKTSFEGMTQRYIANTGNYD